MPIPMLQRDQWHQNKLRQNNLPIQLQLPPPSPHQLGSFFLIAADFLILVFPTKDEYPTDDLAMLLVVMHLTTFVALLIFVIHLALVTSRFAILDTQHVVAKSLVTMLPAILECQQSTILIHLLFASMAITHPINSQSTPH